MSEEHRPSVSEETYKSLAEGFEKQLIEERSRSKRLAEALQLLAHIKRWPDELPDSTIDDIEKIVEEALAKIAAWKKG